MQSHVSIIQKFLSENPKEKNFYDLASDIFHKRINSHTIFKYFKTQEDVDYLFKITNQKILGEVRGTLKMISKDAGVDEKQMINFLQSKKGVYKSAVIVILCLLKFKFILTGKYNRRKKANFNQFRFESTEENALFLLYLTYNIDKKHITALIKTVKTLPLKKAFIFAFLLKIDMLLESVLDKWGEDLFIQKYVFQVYGGAYDYMAAKMINMSNKECLKILKIGNLNKIRIAKLFLKECMKKFIDTKDERSLNRNLSFTEICLEVNISEHLYKRPEKDDSSIENKLNIKNGNTMFKLPEKKEEKANISIDDMRVEKDIPETPSITAMRKIIYAWLRLLIVTHNPLLFLEIFEKLKEHNDEEYKILQKIYKQISENFRPDCKGLHKLFSEYTENNEFSPISFHELAKYT